MRPLKRFYEVDPIILDQVRWYLLQFAKLRKRDLTYLCLMELGFYFFMKELPKAYSPQNYESGIYKQWEDSGFFNPDNLNYQGEPFSISMPPPNATGILHLGHAVMLAIQDLMSRYWRLRGRRTLWLPGEDHAAIATQNVVEKKLYKEEGKNRFDYGREEFMHRVNEFVNNSRSTIKDQIKAMGASCDWSRERYTLDEGLSRAVKEAFIRMYNDGLIYRGKRIVNWCYRCGTTLADDEVEYKEQKTPFYYLKYGPIIIGTARPETKVLDKVIIVHPDDERYKKYIGTSFDVPWIDGIVRAQVVADKIAKIETGTGAMTITPAHSFVDFELAQKYGFEIVEIIGPDGKMTQNAGKFAGLNVKEARVAILEELQNKGLVERIDNDYIHNLSVCYRCGTAVEPLPSEQWFVAVDKPFRRRFFKKITLKKMALAAVKEERIKIIPERFIKVYEHWMNNLHDWCISRQIWFGHRIPAWQCQDCKEWQVIASRPTKIIFSRHGLTDWNKKERIQGDTNIPLDESEIELIYKKAYELKNNDIQVIISSPLMRARQTANIFAEVIKAPIIVEKRIKERYYGTFEGKLVAELKQDHPDYYKNKLSYHVAEAESYQQIKQRLIPWLSEVVIKFQGQKVLIVTHNAIMRTLKWMIEGGTEKELSEFKPRFDEPLQYELIGSCKKCGSWRMKQDEDTLDTWFSSSLWTFSTLGWPGKTKDLSTYHPTSVMETGYDILFFWVARMILMSAYCLGDIPFRTVYLHGLVRDKQGRKMSKSLGNGIDPIEMIGKYGADALRLSMIIGVTPGNDFRLYDEKIAGYRNFVNKLWNIVRFANLTTELKVMEVPPEPKTLADKWILSRFSKVADLVTKKIESYSFSEAGETLYDFTWHELADWYLEITKIEGRKQEILSYLISQLLKLWHPFMPFVTEALWQETFGNQAGLLIVQLWPKNLPAIDNKSEIEFTSVQDIIISLRNYRAEIKLDKKIKVKFCLVGKILNKNEEMIISDLRTGAEYDSSIAEKYSKKVDFKDFNLLIS